MTKKAGAHAELRCPLKRVNGSKRNFLVKPTPIYPRKQRKPCELFSPASIIEQENKENLLLKPLKIEIINKKEEIISDINKITNLRRQSYQHLNNDMSPHPFTSQSIYQTTSQVNYQYACILLGLRLY